MFSGKRLLYIKAVITAKKLAGNPDDYFCQCTAWYLDEAQAWQRISSAKGHIRQGLAPACKTFHYRYCKKIMTIISSKLYV